MPSTTQQADRRVEQYREELERLRSRATRAAQALNDSSLLRGTIERLIEVLSPARGTDAIGIAVQVGAAREVLNDFKEAVAVVEKVAELRRQIEKLEPLTTAEAKVV